ncbi:hypothetical protein B7P43_G07583 [Cryptotermes secundus]|uniref:DUF4817 domain-containing protein n=1 Tax=Cryptotermes secundus TaxID=105785 RepID=A0A2J7QHS9_9NEOP|nr:hypothetical protein B7P43_G07583 [Cryptotermes secundus]
MVSPQQKVFCVLEFAKTNSVVMVQHAFRRRFGINPPCPKNIRWWFRQFQESGCLRKGKSPGRPRVSEEQVARICAAFDRSLRKSTNQQKRMEFCDSMLETMEDKTFISHLIFSDEATFRLSGTVNRHNVHIWGTEHPHETVEHERDSPKVNVFCAVSQKKVYGPFFFEGKTVTGQTYLDMLQNWLFTSLQADSHDFIFQQDGALPHWHLMVRAFLNEKVPLRWFGWKGTKDLALCVGLRDPQTPPCAISSCGGYVKDHVYVPLLPTNLDDLKH